MKPIQVDAGQYAPDVDEIVEKANSMIEKVDMDNSQIRNITGVEEAPMTHYYTNQNQPSESVEEITNKGASSENVSFIDANPHQTGSTLSAHENSAGGEGGSVESSSRYGAGSSGVTKGPLPDLGGGGKLPLPDLGGGGDKSPLPDLGGLGGGDKPDKPDLPEMGDEDDDAKSLGDRIKSLVEKLVDKADGGEGGDKPPELPPGPPMGGGGPPAPPPGGGGGGPPAPMM